MKRDTPKYVVELAKELRINQTKAEFLLWERLRNTKLNGYKFRRQYAIGRYIADFYCVKVRLVIELDGNIHNETFRREYDFIRQNELESRNIRVLRFRNEEVLDNLNAVLKQIEQALSPLPISGEGLG